MASGTPEDSKVVGPELVLERLGGYQEPVSCKVLAEELGVDKKRVNSALYTLLGRKAVIKSEDKVPLWWVDQRGPTLRRRIVRYLDLEEWTATGDLLARLKKREPLENLTTKELNSVLYGMQKENLVEKTAEANGTKPRWRRTRPETASPEQE